jgi:hypothetical protein
MAKRLSKTFYVFASGSHIGQVQAATPAAALRKARYQWGSSGEWSDAQLRKFTVRLASGNPRKVKGRSTTLRNMASVTIQKLPNGVVKITGRKMAANPPSKRHPSGYTPKTLAKMYRGGKGLRKEYRLKRKKR